MGSVAYMSPEQTEGDKVDFRTDIWSVGVVLYEMLAGKRPFSAEYEQAVMYQIMNENPEFITKLRSDVPREVENVLEKALSKKPQDRYKDIGDMLKELQITADEHKEGLTTKSFVSRMGRKQRKQFFRSIAAVIILVIIAVYFWRNNMQGSEPISIVLLPLESIVDEAENEWFSDGMTDALITDLAKIKGLQVISRSSAMLYKGAEKTVKEIAAELGVDYILEGSVSRIENQIKISTRLINAINDIYLWGEEYEREFKDVLSLQGEIAQAIAEQIEVELTPQEENKLNVTRQVNPETYELYLKGMYHINKYTPEGFTKGFEYLNKAAEIDPEDPLPHSALALAYCILAHTPAPPPNAMAMALSEATIALELDDSLAEVYLTFGMLNQYQDWDQPAAEKNIRQALSLNPNLALAYAHLAFNQLLTGNNEIVLAEAKRAQELDPLVPLYPAWNGWIYYWLGQFDEAIIEASKSIELLADFPIGLYVIGCAQAAKGNFEEAIAAHQRVGEVDPSWKWALGQTYALAGRNDEAQQIASELENKGSHWDAWGIAEIYTALGDYDKALFWLEKAFEQKHPYALWLTCNPNFDVLNEEPRYKALVQKLNIPD
jgi:TolB-like protein/TPR repeat protein